MDKPTNNETASKPAQTAAEHRRENHGLLAQAEKAVLIRIAERIPASVQPDHLTAIGLAALCLCGIAFVAAHWHPAFVLLVAPLLALNWFGDSLDGTLARVRKTERPRYGFYLDHVVDVVGTLALCVGVGLSPFMHPMMAAAMLVAYLSLTAETYLATHALGTFRMAFFRIGPTELRILLAVGAFATWLNPQVEAFGWNLLLFDLGAAVGILGMAATFLTSTIRNARELARREPAPASKLNCAPSSHTPAGNSMTLSELP